MVFIYVLKCQNNKFYVGKTENPDYRLESHFAEGGSVWTKKYKPIQLYQLMPDQTDHDEQRFTQEYMEKYFKGPHGNKNAEIPQVADLEYGMENSSLS